MAECKSCDCCLRDNENNNGEAWCCDCTKLDCKTYFKCHKNLSTPHQIIPVEEPNHTSYFQKLPRHCEIYNDQKMVLFCCQRDQLVCDSSCSCVYESHRNHKSVISVEMASTEIHTSTEVEVTDLEKRINNLTRTMQDVMSKYNTERSNLSQQTINIKMVVADIKQKIITHLNEIEADFNIKLDRKAKERMEKIERCFSEVQGRYETLTTLKENIKSLKDNTLNDAIKHLDVTIHKEEIEFQELKTDFCVSKLTFKPAMEVSKIFNLLPSFGTLSLDNMSFTTSSALNFTQCLASVNSEIQNRQPTLVSSFEISALGNGVSIGKGCFLPDDQLCLCEVYGERVFICDHDGSNSKIINLDCYPLYVTLYDRNTALVSVGDQGIQIINTRTLKLGKRIKVGMYCGGITSSNQKIWMKSNTYTLTKITLNGQVKKTASTSFVPSERDICLTKDGGICYTGYDSHGVFVVTSNGEERFAYSSPDLRYPAGITVDNHGYIYVAGRDSHNIHKISSDGQQSKIVLSEKDGIFKPTGLSFNQQSKELMVINVGGKCINIYKLA